MPTLCLTSPADVVVPEAGVREFAAALGKAQPARSVRVLSLQGTHAQLLSTDPAAFARALGDFFAEV